ncbi:resistance-nodulation-cell division (RND) efflux membrane fusion protein [Undibacterium macrobrachii]|jgi:RND family efflux transporter MFP subunit|uniref:Resistance-nodulation-cell division (RND) efflux membrane fusion protein n=2 Tax=Undibacterium macrobrachii TaxID=1119058 RepID=A0ABQ2XJ56_9BURK|nr:resistance-nodulation-cell division (RND) efflux membrane fusion protein [Undibacterium macrobrachii]
MIRKKIFLAMNLLGLAAMLSLTACSKKVEKTEDIRPVRAIQAQFQGTESAVELSGEVRAKIESRLGFRVPGKIVARKVELGTVVTRGQVLMQLDPQDLLLGQAQARAGLSAAESNRDLAKAELKRYQELREKNFVAQAVLDAKETAYKAAQASYEQAKAALSNQSNQAGYASLLADIDGVVTGIEAEVGQVVAAGTPVVRVAKAGDMDVVVGVPEDKINSIRQLNDIKVKLWANSGEVYAAKLRELSPIADPVTRTFVAKIALPNNAKDVQLGMTANVIFGMKSEVQMVRLPLTALFQEKNVSSVWIVESGAVKLVPVQIGSTSGEDVLISSGIQAGQTVVTAGVNLLKAGQKVHILGVESAPTRAAASAAPASVSASAVGASK